MDGSFDVFLLSLVAVTIGAVWYALDYWYAPKRHPNEPPVVSHNIPYIGHVLGLLRHGSKYFEKTSAKCQLPIYTLNMLNGKVYIVTSPELVSAVNRNSGKIAFNPFIAMVGKRMTGHDEATSNIVQHNLNGENGTGYVIDVHDGIVASLAPGKSLEKMTKVMLLQSVPYLNTLTKDGQVDLFEWTQTMMTLCSTRAIYGPRNPLNVNSKLVDLFWQYDHNMNLLLVDCIPSITASKGNHAREKLAAAFQSYFEHFDPVHSQSSAMIQARYAVNTQYGVTSSNAGRLEVGTLVGILANTIPSIFYMLVHVYSDPNLTADIRTELSNAGFMGTPEEIAQNPRLLKISELCPLLHSTWQELLRVHALGASSRYLLDDVTLDNQYLLKKGNVLQMPMAVMHNDAAAWGSDVKEFQPRRFFKRQSSTEKGFKHSLASYRPFGGGASLCPGRHFVTLETLTLVACLLSRFDIEPVQGPWVIPEQKQESMATNVFPPERDVRVRVTVRRDVETDL